MFIDLTLLLDIDICVVVCSLLGLNIPMKSFVMRKILNVLFMPII